MEKQIEFTATTLLTLVGMVEVAILQNPHLFLKLLVGKLFLPIPENTIVYVTYGKNST